MKLKEIAAYIGKNKGKCFLTLFGLIAAILMLSIGFFRTLLIIVLTAVCYGYGFLIDKFGFGGANSAIAEFFKKLFSKR